MKILKILIPSLLFTACGTPSQNNETVLQTPNAQPTSAIHSESPDGTVKVDQIPLRPAQIAAERATYQRTDLVELPIDASFNANVFRITDQTIPDYRNKAFVAPKLYCYGGTDGAEVIPLARADGQVTLSFNVVFSDGVTPFLSSVDGSDARIPVPDLLRIQNKTALASVLKNQFGIDGGLATLPGCPKKLTLSVAGQEYDVTPSDFARGDFCQINMPTTISLTLPKEDAKQMLEIALPANLVDLRGTYETEVAIPTAKVEIHFDRAKIFQDLRAKLGVKTAFIEAEVDAATTSVTQKQLMSVIIQGNTSDLESELIRKVSADFFESFLPTPNTPEAAACGNTPVCFRFSFTHQNQSSVLDYSFYQDSNVMSGQNYITSTKLKSTPTSQYLGDKACAGLEQESNHYRVGACDRIQNNGVRRDTLFAVKEGSQITITPDYAILEQRNNPDPSPVTTHHSVCTQRITFPIMFTQVCAQYEDQWSQITNYSELATSDRKVLNPASQLNQFFEGISFGFKWTDAQSGETKELTCPLSLFERTESSTALTITLKNMPTCHPFSGSAGERPVLQILSQIVSPTQYLSGQETLLWNGNRTTTVTAGNYLPKIDFAATLAIDEHRFESVSSSGKF